jgi:flagellar basal body-associated protein FliL
MNKRAAELSLTMIIVAVVLLLVLAVVGFIFFKGTNTFQKGVSDCSGECQSHANCPEEYPVAVPMKCLYNGDEQGTYCCKKFS